MSEFKKGVLEELSYRGLISSMIGNVQEQLDKEPTTFYVGTDPTGDSLHVGHLQVFIITKILQKYGHKPIILIGGATASLGDPSFKAEERKLISREEIDYNASCIKKQLEKIIDFNSKEENAAVMVNNYDWMKDISFIDFAREVGKKLTVNYMLAKDSVKMRLEREGCGLSLTEFLYGPIQGNDFLHLYNTMNCKMQLGGEDQKGNIFFGFELLKKTLGSDNTASALTCPLVTRADGKKFGKSEGGKNCWLSAEKTSPYEFYQFWLNQPDEDSKVLIKKFTLLSKEEIEEVIAEHEKSPQKRILQSTLAKELTIMVHSKEDYESAVEASKILFGNGTTEQLSTINETTFLSAMDGVPTFEVSIEEVRNGISLIDLSVTKTSIIPSKNEFRKLVQGGGLSVNKTKVSDINLTLNTSNLLNNKYLLIQKGKKNYNLVVAK